MKRILITLAICSIAVAFANAQNTLKDNLSAHVHYLASDDMRGRAENSPEAEKAADYIKQQLRSAGFEIFDYVISEDSVQKVHSTWFDKHYKMKKIPGYTSGRCC